MADGTQVAVADNLGAVMEQVMINGDLTPLTPEQRSHYYMRVCESIGVNHLTKPFAYIKLNGKLVLYALRDCADQLRKIHGISIEIVSRSERGDLLMVHVKARTRDGREDEDFGAVTLGSLKGDAAANAIMKAITKAKRRVTLSISGLGMLDETELETIPPAALQRVQTQALSAPKAPPPAQPKGPPSPPVRKLEVDETVEALVDPMGYLEHLDEELAAACDGTTFDEVWSAHLESTDGRLSRAHQQTAERLHEKHAKRLRRK